MGAKYVIKSVMQVRGTQYSHNFYGVASYIRPDVIRNPNCGGFLKSRDMVEMFYTPIYVCVRETISNYFNSMKKQPINTCN